MQLRERPNKQLPEIKKQKCNKKETWVEMASIETQTDFTEEKIDCDDIYDPNIEYKTQTATCFDDPNMNFPNLRWFTTKNFREDAEETEDTEAISDSDIILNDKPEYKPIHVFSSKVKLDSYFKSMIPTVKLGGAVKVKCNLCADSCQAKMVRYYRICNCKLETCNLKFKINKCDSNTVWVVSQNGSNMHAFENLNLLYQLKQTDRSIFPGVKDIIDHYLNSDKDITPKRIHIKLIERSKDDPDINKNLPQLKQIQSYVRRFRKINYSNQLDEVKAIIKSKMFDANLEDDELFYFNVDLDKDGLPEIGTGKPDNHLAISMSSKKLLNNLQHKGCFHIDCTYKVIKNGFPVLVFGITDRQGHFHPIAFHITSHEEEGDFSIFYNGLIKIAKDLDIAFEPEFIMQDAWTASYNAAIKCFPKATVLMCYYHVMDNIKKKLYKLNDKSDDLKDEVMELMRYIHMSPNEKEFNNRKKTFEDDFKLKHADFYNYVKKQWLDSSFNKWQNFRTPPGYAATNSPIESYNATIKRDYTLRKRLSVGALLARFATIVQVESHDIAKKFSLVPAYNNKLKDLVQKLAKGKFIKMNVANHYKFNGARHKYVLNIMNCTCSCSYYLKYMVCAHLAAFSNHFNMKWFNDKYNTERVVFDYKAKRGAKLQKFKKAEKALVRDTL